MNFLDLFSGIGGFRLGLERNGHTPVGYVEIDKFARRSYNAMFDTSGEWTATDITKVTDEEWSRFNGKVDIIAGGFPCQAFSIAGKRLGFLDSTKGTLFFDIARAAKQIKPRYLFLENVKGLLNHDSGNTFRTILNTLDELGYDVEWRVLNSKDFGVPQNRERVYIIGHLREDSGQEVFPFFGENGSTNQENEINSSNNTGVNVPEYLVIDDQGRKTKKLLPLKIVPTLRAQSHGNEPKVMVKETTNQASIKQVGNINNSTSFGGNPQTGRVYDADGIAPTLNTMQGGGREPKVLVSGRVRTLTPRECWRLQAFSDELFDKAQQSGISDSQLYKQAGNSVTVNVIEAIAEGFK